MTKLARHLRDIGEPTLATLVLKGGARPWSMTVHGHEVIVDRTIPQAAGRPRSGPWGLWKGGVLLATEEGIPSVTTDQQDQRGEPVRAIRVRMDDVTWGRVRRAAGHGGLSEFVRAALVAYLDRR